MAEIWKASERLAGSGVLSTPLLDSQWLAGPFDDGRQPHRPASALLKLENRQVTGSFKARGALNKVRCHMLVPTVPSTSAVCRAQPCSFLSGQRWKGHATCNPLCR